jgi:hypothetical protein
MRTWHYFVLAFGLTAWLGGSAYAQFVSAAGIMGGGPATLLLREDIQKELQLSAEQIRKIRAVSDEIQRTIREGMARLEDQEPARSNPEEREQRVERRKKVMQSIMEPSNKKVADILTPAQIKRLNQILLQRQGAQAFSDPGVQKSLHLTPDQIARLKTINNELAQEMRQAFRNPGADVADMRTKGVTRRKEALAKALAVLSDEQTKIWKDLEGAPFDIQAAPPGGGSFRTAPVQGPGTRQIGAAGPRPGTPEGDLAWVAKRVQEWQPTKQERRVDDIGWAKDLREALRLGKENGRPIFLFTYEGRMTLGRC